MATLEQIIDEARKLPVEERRRLRAALDTLESNGTATMVLLPEKARSSNIRKNNDETRRLRMEWLRSHREEYGGQYVALDDDRLLAIGPTYKIAKEGALAAGKPNAFITYLSKADEIAELGGWA